MNRICVRAIVAIVTGGIGAAGSIGARAVAGEPSAARMEQVRAEVERVMRDSGASAEDMAKTGAQMDAAVRAAGATPAAKAPAAAPAVPAPLRDCGKGFEQFRALGLPDSAGADYVQLQAYDPTGGDPSISLYDLRLSGNAWMLQETPKVKGRFIQNGTRVLEVWDYESLQKERMKKLEEIQKTNQNVRAALILQEEEGEQRIGGNWKKANLKKDIDKTLAYLQKLDEKSDRYDSLSHSGGYGILFIQAAHYYRNGFTNEANRIVNALFARAGDQKRVISDAIDRLAESQYADAYEAFRKSGDWAAFGRQVDGLLGKFFASWKKAPGAKKLSEEIKKRQAQPQPPEPVGEGLTAEDKALAAELAAADSAKSRSRRYSFRGSHELWVLPEAPRRGPVPAAEKGKESVVEKITQRGMKSVPLLLALTKDQYLTPLDLAESTGGVFGGRYASYEFMREGRESRDPAAAALMAYNSLSRPAARSEIALALLQPLVPRKENERRSRRGEPNPAEIVEECRAWYEANRGKKPTELARTYLTEGDESQQQAAIAYLTRAGTEADFEAIEKHFLESSDVQDTYRVREYVDKRGDKAKAFVEKLEAHLNQQMATGANEMFKNKDIAKSVKEQIDALKELVSAEPLTSLVEQVASGRKTLDEVSAVFHRRLVKEKRDDALRLLLNGALKAQDADTAAALVQRTMSVGRGEYGEGEALAFDEDGDSIRVPPDEATVPGKRPGPDIKLHAELWKKLLADARPLRQGMPGVPITVGDAAAWAIGLVYGPPVTDWREYRDRPTLGRRTTAICRARAEALLAGKAPDDLPPFPSVKDATKEKRKAVAAKILAAPAEGLAPAVAALNDEDLLALMTEARKDKALNLKLVPVSHKITAVSVDPTVAAEAGDLASLKGKALDRAAVEKLFAAAGRLAAGGKVAACSATRALGLDGVEIAVRAIPPESREYKTLFDSGFLREGMPAEVRGTVADSASRGNATWTGGKKPAGTPAVLPATAEDRLLEEAVAAMEADVRKTSENEQKEFWAAVDQFMTGEGGATRLGVISFMSKPSIRGRPKPAEASKAGAAAPARPAAAP